MTWDAASTNRLLFTYGNIQCSPEEVSQLNRRPPSSFKPQRIMFNADLGYALKLNGYAEFILHRESARGHRLRLELFLSALRANPRPLNGKQLKGSVDTRSVEGDFYRVDYRILNGEVLVYNIEPVTAEQRARDKREQPALYRVKRNAQGFWRVEAEVSGANTAFAAINGQSNNLAKASWLMGSHLEFEFGGQVVEFTLFHNPSRGSLADTWESLRDKIGLTTPLTRLFAQTLLDAAKGGTPVKWVAHSQGGVIFAEAVRFALNNSPQTEQTSQPLLLGNHSVAMHGNANNNWRSQKLFDRAGVKVIATRANSYDFVNTIIGSNTARPWRIAGSLIYGRHVVAGSVQQSPHTLMHKDWQSWSEVMDTGPGKGRSAIQKAFHAIDSRARKSVEMLGALPR